MYDELIDALRLCVKYGKAEDVLENAKQAADAIEELVRKEKFHAFLWNTIQPNEMEQYISMYNAGNEKEKT